MPIYMNAPYRSRNPRISVMRRKKKAPVYKKRQVSSYVKSLTHKKRVSYKPRKKYNTGSRVNTRKKYVHENKSTENQVISLKMGARPITALGLARSAMSPSWFRVQGVTQYDTSTGFYPLSARNLTAAWNTAVVTVPVHLWEITAVTNTSGLGVFEQPSVGWSVGWTSTGGTGNVVMNSLQSQASSGSTLTTSSPLQLENVPGTAGTLGTIQFRKSFHEWTNIKLNLYGVRSRATRYNVSIIMLKESEATDPLGLIGNTTVTTVNTNQKCKDLMDYMARPYLYNNILLGDVQARSYIKVLKSYDVTIDPITTIEYGGATSVPHIQTVNWFIRHNRQRRFDWLDTGGQSLITATANYEQNINGVQCRVDPKSRIYLCVRAMSPTFTSAAYADAPDPINEPSYDLVMRHKYLHPV